MITNKIIIIQSNKIDNCQMNSKLNTKAIIIHQLILINGKI
jgi:hypothetical protein